MLNVIVRGTAGSGKSSLMLLLERLLTEKGFQVERVEPDENVIPLEREGRMEYLRENLVIRLEQETKR